MHIISMCIDINLYAYTTIESAVTCLRQTYEYTLEQKSNDEYVREIKDMLDRGEDRIVMDLRWRVLKGSLS